METAKHAIPAESCKQRLSRFESRFVLWRPVHLVQSLGSLLFQLWSDVWSCLVQSQSYIWKKVRKTTQKERTVWKSGRSEEVIWSWFVSGDLLDFVPEPLGSQRSEVGVLWISYGFFTGYRSAKRNWTYSSEPVVQRCLPQDHRRRLVLGIDRMRPRVFDDTFWQRIYKLVLEPKLPRNQNCPRWSETKNLCGGGTFATARCQRKRKKGFYRDLSSFYATTCSLRCTSLHKSIKNSDKSTMEPDFSPILSLLISTFTKHKTI